MGKTSENLIRTSECVINLPSQDEVTYVDRLALTTGKNPVPEKKKDWGYRYEPECPLIRSKFTYHACMWKSLCLSKVELARTSIPSNGVH